MEVEIAGFAGFAVGLTLDFPTFMGYTGYFIKKYVAKNGNIAERKCFLRFFWAAKFDESKSSFRTHPRIDNRLSRLMVKFCAYLYNSIRFYECSIKKVYNLCAVQPRRKISDI